MKFKKFDFDQHDISVKERVRQSQFLELLFVLGGRDFAPQIRVLLVERASVQTQVRTHFRA